MSSATDTLLVSGIRCERCVMRLATALEGQPGLEAAHANLMGEVTLTWDDEVTYARGARRHARRRGLPRRTRRSVPSELDAGRSSAGRIALGGPHCERAPAPRLLTAAAVFPLSAESASVDPKALVLPQTDVPARYLFDPGNSMAIPRSFAVAAKTEGARDLLRAGFVGGYFARYLNTGPPRWRYVTSGAYLFRDSVGARKVLPSMVASMNRGLGRARRVALGDEAGCSARAATRPGRTSSGATAASCRS